MKVQSRPAETPLKAAQTAPADPQLRQQLIAQAAYARWERRGFAHGSDLEDWLAAEAEIEQRTPS